MRCPYCFNIVNNVSFRCINRVPGQCPPIEDAELGRYQRLNAPPLMPRVSEGPLTGAVCAFCKHHTNHGVCPYCHNDLPTNDVSSKSLLFALVGAKNAGKSHYIAVLINELQRLAPSHRAGLMPLGGTIKKYRTDFRSYLYDAHRTIPVTQPAMVNESVRSPLIYRWSRETKGIFNQKIFRVSQLVFFDTAGEDLHELDVMDVETRYVALSDGLIFLLDPLQIPAVRELLKHKVTLPEPDVPPQEIIVHVTQTIRNTLGIAMHHLIEIPIAVTFSKIDAIRDLLDERSPLRYASPHRSELDEADVDRVHESVRAHLAQWMDESLDGILATNYNKFRYFGVSALGAPPSSDGTLHNGVAPAPLRVEDPLLWLLSRYDLVKIKGKK